VRNRDKGKNVYCIVSSFTETECGIGGRTSEKDGRVDHLTEGKDERDGDEDGAPRGDERV
jgi:hypothetical protein